MQNSKTDNVAGTTVSRKLREYYESVMEEAIPDRFLDLLEQLDAADRAQSEKKKQSATGEQGQVENGG